MPAKSTPEREWFAMIPKSLSQLVCLECKVLYAELDIRQQNRRYSNFRGVRWLEDAARLGAPYVKKHLRHMLEVGLIELDPVPEARWSLGNTFIHVIHNPARGRINPNLKPVAGVWEPTARSRPRPRPNRYGSTPDAPRPMVKCKAVTKLGRPCNAWAVHGSEFCSSHGSHRDVSVGGTTSRRDLPNDAPTCSSVSDARRNASSVPISTNSQKDLSGCDVQEGEELQFALEAEADFVGASSNVDSSFRFIRACLSCEQITLVDEVGYCEPCCAPF